MVALTSRTSDAASGVGRAVLSVVLGAASVATMPAAVLATRYSETYELLHAGFAIPVGFALGLVGVLAARSVRRLDERMIGPVGGLQAARLGRILGVLGMCLAGTAAISVGVYWLLEFAGSRE